MVLKRKRSDSEMSFSSSPPPNTMNIDNYSPLSYPQSIQENAPAHLSSRTRKRYRDNRPSESTIHRMPPVIDSYALAYPLTLMSTTEHTLSLLFSAQKNPQTAPLQIHAPAPVAPSNESNHQSSLHSFWSLPARQSSCNSSNSSTTSTSPTNYFQVTNCEDCHASLNSTDGDSMDIDIDIDTNGSSLNHGCSACSRQVCYHCAVSNLGGQRHCLMCAGKTKRWEGGIGWVDQD
jgi:hypothetical protein